MSRFNLKLRLICQYKKPWVLTNLHDFVTLKYTSFYKQKSNRKKPNRQTGQGRRNQLYDHETFNLLGNVGQVDQFF